MYHLPCTQINALKKQKDALIRKRNELNVLLQKTKNRFDSYENAYEFSSDIISQVGIVDPVFSALKLQWQSLDQSFLTVLEIIDQAAGESGLQHEIDIIGCETAKILLDVARTNLKQIAAKNDGYVLNMFSDF